MSGIFTTFGGTTNRGIIDSVAQVLDPYGTDRIETIQLEKGILASFIFSGLPAEIKRTYNDGRFAGVLAGDVVAEGAVPWDSMIAPIRDGRPEKFPELPGFFALILHDRSTGRVWVVSDMYCFHPVFYRITAGRVDAASHQGAFALAGPKPQFNPGWLWEHFYFSTPLGPTGMYKGVVRPPTATVTGIDPASGAVTEYRYGRRFRPAERLLTGAAAIEKAVEVFQDVVPQYYGYPGTIVHALSGGWDCRTLSGLMPEKDAARVTTYTYGQKGSNDLVEAARVARAMGFPHRELPFDAPYVERIPLLSRETVFQSGGLEGINRTYLPNTYHTITSGGTTNPWVISGIGADAMFRGHVQIPNGLSHDITKAFRTGKRTVNDEFFRGVFGDRFGPFREHVDGALDWFEKEFGGFGSVRNYVEYKVDQGLPRYYNGECLIADHCGSLRAPYLHPDVIQLACDIEYGVGKNWVFINDDIYREYFVQSALIETNPRLRKVPMYGIPIHAFSCRNKARYRIIQLVHKGPRKLAEKIGGKRRPGMENWDLWYRTVLSPTFAELLGPDARVREYLDGGWVDEVRDARTFHWLKLVTTAEITLRLVENGWKRFWDRPF